MDVFYRGKDRTRQAGATEERERAVDNNAVQQSQFVYLSGCETPVLARLSYAPSAPFTVSLAFRVDSEEWVEWEFSRDLLITGLHAPAGIGDIRIRPDLPAPDDALLVIELESPDGYAAVEIDRGDVQEFVEATLSRVPLGYESERLDLDAVITSLTTARP
ncbi:SsgA family sporulation/cell division regulator [Saccharomonospora piscinae]|uniref:SsgA family sporulation/cell division regulator n=1 Tax=Saccharomonospora piscinae TaxID=687388 RepID=UPI001106A8F6|nr:SsgA family sporulation/cell division regulator [Saccharomonospora piscinae]TLW93538.1 SsgA family sporulation/cell division regulator [Saccharomonospora piscinae]